MACSAVIHAKSVCSMGGVWPSSRSFFGASWPQSFRDSRVPLSCSSTSWRDQLPLSLMPLTWNTNYAAIKRQLYFITLSCCITRTDVARADCHLSLTMQSAAQCTATTTALPFIAPTSSMLQTLRFAAFWAYTIADRTNILHYGTGAAKSVLGAMAVQQIPEVELVIRYENIPEKLNSLE